MIKEFDLITLNNNKYLVNCKVQYNSSIYLLLTNINKLDDVLYAELESDNRVTILTNDEVNLKIKLDELFIKNYIQSGKRITFNNIIYDKNNKEIENYSCEIFVAYHTELNKILSKFISATNTNITEMQFLNYFPNVIIKLYNNKTGTITYSNKKYKMSLDFIGIFDTFNEVKIVKIEGENN